MAERVFISHSHHDGDLAVAIAAALQKCTNDGVFCFENENNSDYPRKMNHELSNCSHMVLIIGDKKSIHQENEASSFYASHKNFDYFYIVDNRKEVHPNLPKQLRLFEGMLKYCVNNNSPVEQEALIIARAVAQRFGFPWRATDGLPANPHLFDYEKDIIDFYTQHLSDNKELNEEHHQKLLEGAPIKWPEVENIEGISFQNSDELKDKVGEWRDPHAKVLVAALSKYHNKYGEQCKPMSCQMEKNLCFPEAGPRKDHIFPRDRISLKVGVLVSGGIAPGINAVIDGIVNRHYLYAKYNRYQIEIYGYINGFEAFDNGVAVVNLFPNKQRRRDRAGSRIITSNLADVGGSMIGTSRPDKLIDPGRRQNALNNILHILNANNIDILYIIGGDGSMKAAHALRNQSKALSDQGITRPLSVIGIPKSMDNDILWVWQSFGFLSAVEKAREVIQELRTEVASNPRLCVVQLFGSDSGFVVSHAVLASQTGTCDVALIPEVSFSMKKLAHMVMNRMAKTLRKSRVPFSLIVMAETAIPTDAIEYIDLEHIGLIKKEKEAIRKFDEMRKMGKRIQGQTDEWLRSAGLKIVSRGLEYIIKYENENIEVDLDDNNLPPRWDRLRVFTNEPRHQLRSIPPSCMDIINGQRLGTLAVDNALAGYTDFMISQWLTEYVLVPLGLVVLGRKRIPKQGVFWRSVKSKTDQGDLA